MKCLRRWLINGIAAGSLLLALAMSVIWMRSYWHYDSIDIYNGKMDGGGGFSVESAHGGAKLIFFAFPSLEKRLFIQRHAGEPWSYPYTSADRPNLLHGKLVGFAFALFGYEKPASHLPTIRWIEIIAPIPVLVAVAAIVPSLWLRERLRRRRECRVGFCAMCGYDLRATPDRCPECGTIAQTGQKARMDAKPA